MTISPRADRALGPSSPSAPLVMVKGAYDGAGGPETVLQTIVRHLDRDRFPPLLTLLAQPERSLPPVLAGLVAEVQTCRLPWRGLSDAPRTARRIAGLLAERPGAILHTNDMRADLLAWMITRFQRVPWIAHVHGWLRHTHSGKHKVYENIDRYLIRGADLVLVGSSAMAEEVRLAGGRRVDIVTNGIPASDPALQDGEATAIRARIGPGAGLLVGVLGRLHPGKGQALLIEALAGLRGRGLGITVVLMGEGPAEMAYRELAQSLGVAPHVHFAGLVPHTLPWLRAMDIVCVPSLKDSLPLTTLEAMSMARPIVASRAGDLPLAITDGRDGLLVDVGSAAALEAAVERLARSPALRAEFGEAGRRTLLARYTPEAMLRQLEGYCAQLLAERPVPAERRRILYVQPNSEVGGSDIALLRMVEALDPERFAPVVVLPAEGPLAPMLRTAGATVRVLPMMQLRTLPSPVYQTRYLAHLLPTVRRLAELIREERAELVHSNSLYCLYGGFAARLAGCPHLWHVREIPPAIPVARPALGRMVLGLSRMVVCMTQACADALFGPYARDRRVRLLSEGLDLSEWSRTQVSRSIRQELGIAPGVAVVGFVARLDPWKGLDVFLDAAVQVAADFPDAMFLVSGDAPAGFEAYRDSMVARAASVGLGERIRFLGWRYRLGDIPALMADLDVFCHTSTAPEPFGLVIIEAMAMGCPVIAARAGGPVEIVEHGVSGLLTPPGDATALAAALRDLLADPERRARLATAGRARVEAVYSRAAFGARLSALSDEALAGRLT